MELFLIFIIILIADIATTLIGIRRGLEDVWFGRRATPMFALAAAQIAGFYAIMMLLPIVPYMEYVVYGVLAFRAAVVVWNIYLIFTSEKTGIFFYPFFSGRGFLRRSRSPRQP